MQSLQESDWINIEKTLQNFNANNKNPNSFILILPNMKELPAFLKESSFILFANIEKQERCYTVTFEILNKLLPDIPVSNIIFNFRKYGDILKDIDLPQTPTHKIDIPQHKTTVKNTLVNIIKNKKTLITITKIKCTIFLLN